MGRGRKKQRKVEKLSDTDRGRIIGQKESGVSIHQIAKNLRRPRSTIRSFLKKYKMTSDIKDRPRSGRPKVTNEREDRHIVLTSLKDRRLTAKAIAIKRDPNMTKN